MIYLIDALPNGMPTRFGSTECHCVWQAEDPAWPRDCFRSLMTYVREHLNELGGATTAGTALPGSGSPTQPGE